MTGEQRRPGRRFRLVMGTLALAAVVSGGAAYAASRDDSPQAHSQAIVNDAAGTLGVDPTKLSAALKKALENDVDAQVTAGKLSQARADAIKKSIEDGTRPIFGGPGFGGRVFGHGNGGFGFGFGGERGFGHGRKPGFGFGLKAAMDEVATYLELTPAALRAQLESGKSLSAVATAQGKTVEGLKAAITAATTKQLDAAVTAGRLTKDQETKILAEAASHLDDLINAVPGARGFGHRAGFGFGPIGDMDEVATYLGLTPAALRAQLESGKSLSAIATAQGKTVEGLKAAITAATTKQLDAAVTAGKAHEGSGDEDPRGGGVASRRPRQRRAGSTRFRPSPGLEGRRRRSERHWARAARPAARDRAGRVVARGSSRLSARP